MDIFNFVLLRYKYLIYIFITSEMSTNQQPIEETKDVSEPKTYTKSDYIHAKAVISAYKEAQKNRPKRQCSQKQLEALAKGREANMKKRQAKQ